MNLEFFIRMRDMMSGGLAKLATTAQNTFTKVQGQVNKVTSRNKVLSASFDEIRSRMQQVESVISRSRIPSEIRAARRELSELQKMSDRHVGNMGSSGSGGGGFLSGVVRQALPVMGIAGMLSLGSGAISDGLQAQSRSASFEVMAGKEAGAKLDNNLTTYAQDSIYGNEVYQNAQTMMGFGIEAEEVMPNMEMLGDIAMGDSNKLNSLTLAFSQVKAAGKLTGQDLLQFVNAGFNPLQVIFKKTGISLDTLKEAVSDGAVSFEMVEAAFKSATGEGGRYHNMVNKIAETDFGKVQAFQGQLEGLSMQIGGMLAPIVGDLISNYLEPLVKWLGESATWTKENWHWIGMLVSVFGTALITYKAVTLATNAGAIATRLWTAAMVALNVATSLNPVGIIIASLAALVVGIMLAWNKFEGFRMVVYGLWDAFKQVFQNIGEFFTMIFAPIFEAIAAFKEKRYVDAGVAVAKVAYNLVTLPFQATNFALNGGLTEGVVDAYQAGTVKGKNKPETTPETEASEPSSGTPTDAFAGLSGYKGGDGGSEGHAKGVTSGGPRVININGVKFSEKIELHVQNITEGLDQLEEKFDEYLLRILNSGAALQN